MADRPPPNTRLELRDGEDIWSAMARELASHPDSPASLRILSAVGQATAPSRHAAEQLLQALEAQESAPGDHSNASVAAAVKHWEAATRSTLDDAQLRVLRSEAQVRVERRRRRPPPIDSIIADRIRTTDVGYEHGLHLHGIEGTWHRLWALLALSYSFDDDPRKDEGVAAVRAQLESLLGRPMSDEEYAQLDRHAKLHADYVRANPKPGPPLS